jgi:Skp family chaperone for outer membrane proteins
MSDMDQLKKEIEAGKKLDKVADDEIKAREEEKRKRAEELEKLKAKLKAEGKWTEEE